MSDNIVTLDQGDVARMTATFTDPDSAAKVDPDVVNFRWVTPDGDTLAYTYGTDPEVTRVAAGIYRCHIDAQINGKYLVRAWSTGNGQAAELGAIAVRRDHTQ